MTTKIKYNKDIFNKHYKLKPSFSIIKDNKAKDKVGVGNKPPPSSFNNLIKLFVCCLFTLISDLHFVLGFGKPNTIKCYLEHFIIAEYMVFRLR